MSWQPLLDSAIDARVPDMVRIRRHMHVNPEPSGEELSTTVFLAKELDGTGLQLRYGPEQRGLLVDNKAPAGCSRIALRADIDALRIEDLKNVSYKSQAPRVMHACGHDAHAAVLWGTLTALQEAESMSALPTPIAVRGIFQPAEETSAGALEMVSVGGLHDVAAILGFHVDPSRQAGTIGVKEGVLTAACDEIRIVVRGRGGHAARPHESIDPIAIAATFVSMLYQFVPRSVDTLEPVVVTIGQIHGGDNHNVIPEEVSLGGTLRSFGAATRKRVQDQIRHLADSLAITTRAKIDVQFVPGPDSVNNDAGLAELVRQGAEELLGPERVQQIPRPSMGGEDFANYLRHVPGNLFRLGCAPGVTPAAPLHSPLFDVDERALAVGAKILARAVVNYFLRQGGLHTGRNA